MFEVNDYVVYNAMGVYKIIDIRKEADINNHETEYYVLQPAFEPNLIIKTPVNNPKAVMRGVITKEDVLSLIASMPEKETVWIDDFRERSENFKSALKSGESEEWIKLIRTIYLAKQKKIDHGKKLLKTDEEIMKTAEKNLYEEFAVALDIFPDDVLSFIMDHITDK